MLPSGWGESSPKMEINSPSAFEFHWNLFNVMSSIEFIKIKDVSPPFTLE